jgi:hypothetical protein
MDPDLALTSSPSSFFTLPPSPAVSRYSLPLLITPRRLPLSLVISHRPSLPLITPYRLLRPLTAFYCLSLPLAILTIFYHLELSLAVPHCLELLLTIPAVFRYLLLSLGLSSWPELSPAVFYCLPLCLLTSPLSPTVSRGLSLLLLISLYLRRPP